MSTWQRPTNYSTTTTPISIFSIITRRVFGVTGGRHARSPRSRHAGGLAVWELGLAAALEGGIEEYTRLMNRVLTANAFGVEEIIDPKDTRAVCCAWARHVYEVLMKGRLADRACGKIKPTFS
ncbi:hypothetical protein M432DRAFT_639163 [Thermoascus aurantiacus ATCC 26904]